MSRILATLLAGCLTSICCNCVTTAQTDFAPNDVIHADSIERVSNVRASLSDNTTLTRNVPCDSQIPCDGNPLGLCDAPFGPCGCGVAAPDFPGSWCIPSTKTRFKIGGYVKLDAIYDVNEIGNRFEFLTPTIPTTSDNGGRTTFHARQSRMLFETRSPTELGPVRTYVEGDFFGTGNAFRLRHAYAEVGNWLAGQTWTTFMDISVNPNTLDFEGPPGMVFRRQAQLRYTIPLWAKSKLALAIENPSSAVGFIGGGVNLDRTPDFITNLRQELEMGHVQVAGIARDIGFRPAAGATAGLNQNEWGYGISISGLLRIGGKNNIRYQAAWGNGIGHYFEDLNSGGVATDGGADALGNLELLDAKGYLVAYEHFWNDRIRSNVVFGYGTVDNSAGQPGTAFHSSEYVAVNMRYSPLQQLDVGVEYIYGTHEDAAGNTGEATRIQCSSIVKF